MDVLKKLGLVGVIPVVVLDDAADAVPTARALLAGGVDAMEITFRTDAAADAIRAVAQECPEMLMGAGTVLNAEQGRLAASCGARFLVSPGFDEEMVRWCVENSVTVLPGCVTPTEIMACRRYGLEVVKFFPAGIYGGLSALKALAGPFPGVKFIPTGGVNPQNLAAYMASPAVHAVGGSWLCAREDIAAHRFDRITALCAEARRAVLGFEVVHVGVNCADADESMTVCRAFEAAFGFEIEPGRSSNFASTGLEVMKSVYLGEKGHIAIRTNRIDAAIDELTRRGFDVDMSTAKYKGDRMIAVYLKEEIGGFAIHLALK